MFLITGESGERYGYRDGPRPDGTYWYTGEGQVGDMRMVKGNRAVRDHGADGKSLHLFEDIGGGLLRYLAEAAYIDHHFEVAPDRNENPRRAIVFELELQSGDQSAYRVPDLREATRRREELGKKSLAELREMALRAAPRGASREVRKRNVYERSQAVRGYVLRRANGFCEACGEPAPFTARGGWPYLEPHHITRRADSGLDHPRWVAAICPNCHRRVHSGADGDEYNKHIAERLGELEP